MSTIGNVASYFTQTAMVYRPTFTTAATGAVVSTWSSQAEVAGNLRPFVAYRWGSSIMNGDKLTDIANYRFYCSSTADIREEDRLKIDSLYYRVVYSANVMSMSRLQQVDLKLVSHDG